MIEKICVQTYQEAGPTENERRAQLFVLGGKTNPVVFAKVSASDCECPYGLPLK